MLSIISEACRLTLATARGSASTGHRPMDIGDYPSPLGRWSDLVAKIRPYSDVLSPLNRETRRGEGVVRRLCNDASGEHEVRGAGRSESERCARRGACRRWAGGTGTTPTSTSSCWWTTTPGCNFYSLSPQDRRAYSEQIGDARRRSHDAGVAQLGEDLLQQHGRRRKGNRQLRQLSAE
jgi:hypothetical protein